MDTGIANRLQSLQDVVRAARTLLDPTVWDHISGGSGTETTLRRNRHALDRLGFRPRVLRDVSAVDASGQLLGRRTRLPVVLAPISDLDGMMPGGASAMARGAGQARVPWMFSSDAGPRMEAVAAIPGPKVFQLYVRGDDAWVDAHVRRARDSGFDAFCITVDSAVHARQDRDLANQYAEPSRTFSGPYQAALSWDDISRFKGTHTMPLILKGITCAADAAIACELGVEAIYVSNHGGRQLDHCAGAVELLPEVVAAVAGRATVIVDGGFCRGTDVVKAMALGADAVGLGRLACYGLAAGGAQGVARVVDLIEMEVVECLALLGLPNFAGLDGSYLRAAEAVSSPGLHSAFPQLEA